MVAAQQKELDQFFEVAQDLLCIANIDGTFKKVSQSYERILGYSKNELLAGSFLDLVHPDDIAANKKELEKLSRGIPVLSFVSRCRKKNGEYIHVAWAATPSSDGAIYTIGRDVTELKTFAEKLEQSENKLSLAIAGTSVGIWDWEVKTGREEWSPKFFQLLGYEDQEIHPSLENFSAMLHPDDRENLAITPISQPMDLKL